MTETSLELVEFRCQVKHSSVKFITTMDTTGGRGGNMLLLVAHLVFAGSIWLKLLCARYRKWGMPIVAI
jgi:hypothetical protein